MAEFIDRQELLRAIGKEGAYRARKSETGLAQGLILAMQIVKKKVEPIDVIPVVHCRDCKFAARRAASVYPVVECMRPDVSFGAVRGLDDYCSYGERKESQDDAIT